MIIAILIGISLSLAGAIFSLYTSVKSLKKKSWEEFLASYWMTELIKFSFLIVSILILIIFIEIDKMPLLISFFIGYIFFLLIEVIYLNKSKSFSNFATKNNNKAE